MEADAWTFSEDEIDAIASEVWERIPKGVVTLRGDLGSGKTTLVKAFLRLLGAVDAGSSPTFGLVHTHVNQDGAPLAHHFDLYRVKEPDEVFDLGIEDYMDPGFPVFVEWPDVFWEHLPSDRADLVLEILEDGRRYLRITAGGGL